MMNLSTAIIVFVVLVACGSALSSSTINRATTTQILARPQTDTRLIYLHSTTINTLKEKDLRTMDEETFDTTHHFQYLVHVDTVNSTYTQRITAQIEEWSGKMMYLYLF